MFRVQGAGCRWGVSNGGMKGGRMKGPSNRHLLKLCVGRRKTEWV